MKKILAVLLFYLLVLSSGLLSAKETSPSVSWSQKMQELSSVLQDLLVDSASEERFQSIENEARIQKNLNTLSHLAHEVEKSSMTSSLQVPERDPSLALFSHFLRDNTQRASLAFQKRASPYARHLILDTVSSCMACHTRNNRGPQFDQPLTTAKIEDLSPLEHAGLTMALRHFDQAIQEYRKIIRDKAFAAAQPQAWEKALRQALMLSIRVKNSPRLANELVKTAFANKNNPVFLRESMRAWRKDIQSWKKDPESPKLFEQAQQLVDHGDRSRIYAADHSSDVLYLRATSLIHKYLDTHPDPKSSEFSQALLLAGTTYERLDGLGLWAMPELYYKACIQASPDTDVAKSCYQHYEKSLIQGYSGSGGISFPLELKADLKKLRRKAYQK